MTDKDDSDSIHLTPPIADLTDREAPTPGPLTKPVAVPRASQRRRPRLLLLIILLLVLVAAVGVAWVWSSGAASGEAIEYAIDAAGFLDE